MSADDSIDLDALLDDISDAVDKPSGPATIKFIPHPPLQDKSPNVKLNPKMKIAKHSPTDSLSNRGDGDSGKDRDGGGQGGGGHYNSFSPPYAEPRAQIKFAISPAARNNDENERGNTTHSTSVANSGDSTTLDDLIGLLSPVNSPRTNTVKDRGRGGDGGGKPIYNGNNPSDVAMISMAESMIQGNRESGVMIGSKAFSSNPQAYSSSLPVLTKSGAGIGTDGGLGAFSEIDASIEDLITGGASPVKLRNKSHSAQNIISVADGESYSPIRSGGSLASRMAANNVTLPTSGGEGLDRGGQVKQDSAKKSGGGSGSMPEVRSLSKTSPRVEQYDFTEDLQVPISPFGYENAGSRDADEYQSSIGNSASSDQGGEIFTSLPQCANVPSLANISGVNGDVVNKLRCCRVVLMDASSSRGIKSSVFTKCTCDNMRCINCNFQIKCFLNTAWDDKVVQYMFFRNYMFSDVKLSAGLYRNDGGSAYCCQCNWSSIGVGMEQVVGGAGGGGGQGGQGVMNWVCGGHLPK